jgi:hypothetical protein
VDFIHQQLVKLGQRDGLARIARTITMYIERKLVFPMPDSKYIDPIMEFADTFHLDIMVFIVKMCGSVLVSVGSSCYLNQDISKWQVCPNLDSSCLCHSRLLGTKWPQTSINGTKILIQYNIHLIHLLKWFWYFFLVLDWIISTTLAMHHILHHSAELPCTQCS